MLIIPVGRRPDWRKPPLVTLLLILLNCLIYFGLQSGDGKREAAAFDYYAESSLGAIELPGYINYLEQNHRNSDALAASTALEHENWPQVLMMMETDAAFMKRLRAGKVVLADTEDYPRWRQQRDEFDRLRQASLTNRLGFKPAEPTLASLIGHMFLHGSFDHLLGNMVILFIVGYLVEETLGKRRYLAFYLLAGIGAAGFDLVFNASRIVPGIGASGAISGVMAMFVALYGMRKIRFFYWVLFYFDFFRAPAIVILPLWIINELYQYLFSHGSPVNYMAHLGGFITGALLIGAQRIFSKARVEAPEQEERTERVLDLVELKGFGKKFPWQLSGGMQQRASIARALAFDADILLMDEPFGALDEIVRDRLNEALLDLWARTGKTIGFVTHSIPEAVYLSTKIVVMSPRPGRITDIIDSPLPRDRPLEIRDSPEFLTIAHRVREGLRAGHAYE